MAEVRRAGNNFSRPRWEVIQPPVAASRSKRGRLYTTNLPIRNVTTPKKQLAMVRDWERRNPEAAQARKNEWFKSEAGRAWLKKNQKRRNAARKRWRERKKLEAASAGDTSRFP